MSSFHGSYHGGLESEITRVINVCVADIRGLNVTVYSVGRAGHEDWIQGRAGNAQPQCHHSERQRPALFSRYPEAVDSG